MSTCEVFINPDATTTLTANEIEGDPLAFHTQLSGYEPTRLVASPRLADRLGVASVVVKYEQERFGLPAFKMLGAAWATFRAVAAFAAVDFARLSGFDDLLRDGVRLPKRLVTATDGNHGRAIARLAKMLGIEAHVWVPSDMKQQRISDIEGEGAVVHVVDGSYDLAVTTAASHASHDVIVVSDTAWPGYEEVPAWVVDGYSTIFREIDDQLAQMNHPAPTVVPLPIGVGGLATAAIVHFGSRLDTKMIGVEPTQAACALAALRAGHVVTIDAEFDTEMVGLNCGTVSLTAYPHLATGLHSTMTVDDTWAEDAMRLYHEEALEVGASGAATLAGLLALRDDPPPHAWVPTASDHVLLIATEGPTDPVHHRQTIAAT